MDLAEAVDDLLVPRRPSPAGGDVAVAQMHGGREPADAVEHQELRRVDLHVLDAQLGERAQLVTEDRDARRQELHSRRVGVTRPLGGSTFRQARMYGDGSATLTGPSRALRTNATSPTAIAHFGSRGSTATMSDGPARGSRLRLTRGEAD